MKNNAASNMVSKPQVFDTWPLYLSLLLLVANDYYFKQTYSNWITGKLSDVAGVFLVVLTLRAIMPGGKHRISWTIVTLFVFWKSSLSQPLIEAFNRFTPINVDRVVDYTDVLALVMVPLANYVFDHHSQFRITFRRIAALRIPVIIATVLAITGTSVITPHHRYVIRKETPDQEIDREKALSLIGAVAQRYDLVCATRCDPSDNEGAFSDKEITLRYAFLDNNRGVTFDITGQPSGVIFGKGSWDEMESIKIQLQDALGREFDGMEFVIKLPYQYY